MKNDNESTSIASPAAHPAMTGEVPSLWAGHHPDDAAVRRFAAAMMRKMSASREKGRYGWDDEQVCPTERLQSMLFDHLAKGDPLDVANFCMMLWTRAARVASPAAHPANTGEAMQGVEQGRAVLRRYWVDGNWNEESTVSTGEIEAALTILAAPSPAGGSADLPPPEQVVGTNGTLFVYFPEQVKAIVEAARATRPVAEGGSADLTDVAKVTECLSCGKTGAAVDECEDAQFCNITGRAIASRPAALAAPKNTQQQDWNMPPVAAPVSQHSPDSVAEWTPVVRAGQVRVGDKLRFNIGDKSYSERAKLILHAGTDKEEVIYNRKRNFYFITAMVLSGFSNHKNVQVLASGCGEGPRAPTDAALAASHPQQGERNG